LEDYIKSLYIKGQDDIEGIKALFDETYDVIIIKSGKKIRGYVYNNCIDKMDKLSAREKQVYELLMSGFSNSDIAESLKISYNTVKNHLYNIYKKIGVSDRTQAVVTAINNHQ